MPAALSRIRWGLAAAAALVAAGCSSSTAPQPQLANPAQLSTNLQTISGVVSSPTFQSFGALRTATGSPVMAPSVAGAMLGVAPITPPGTAAQAYAGAPARLQELRLAATSLGSGIAASVIPPSQLGKTYVWDVPTHAYVAQTGGPTNGVRVILYALNPLTGHVAEPTTAVGYVDFLDESTSSTNSLHVIVRAGAPGATPAGTTYADYKVSGTVTGSPATAFTASATGFVTDGTHTLTFNASFAATQLNTTTPHAQIDVTWSLDNPAVSVTLSETLAASDAYHLTVTIHLTETYGAEKVAVDGTVAVVVSPPPQSGTSVTVDLTISVNGQKYATIKGTVTATSNTIQVVHADGSTLSSAELDALSHLKDLPDNLEKAIDDLLHPCERLMGA
jgi:hypothetical protein